MSAGLSLRESAARSQLWLLYAFCGLCALALFIAAAIDTRTRTAAERSELALSLPISALVAAVAVSLLGVALTARRAYANAAQAQRRRRPLDYVIAAVVSLPVLLVVRSLGTEPRPFVFAVTGGCLIGFAAWCTIGWFVRHRRGDWPPDELSVARLTALRRATPNERMVRALLVGLFAFDLTMLDTYLWPDFAVLDGDPVHVALVAAPAAVAVLVFLVVWLFNWPDVLVPAEFRGVSGRLHRSTRRRHGDI